MTAAASEKLFGWVAPTERTHAQHEQHERILAAMPQFEIRGAYRGDVKQVFLWEFSKRLNGGKHIRYVNQVTGSCLKPDALIRMADGTEKKIVDIAIGDRVVSHTGASRAVTDTMNRKYSGDLYTFTLSGYANPISMTGNHLVAVMRPASDFKTRWRADELHWVRADEVKADDRMIIGWGREPAETTLDSLSLLGDKAVELDALVSDGPTPYARPVAARAQCAKSGASVSGKVKLTGCRYANSINRFIPVDKRLGRLIGLYLAEGGVHSGRVVFTFARDEQNLVAEVVNLAKEIFGAEAKVVESEAKKSVTTVRLDNATLAAFFKAIIPGDVYSKKIPACIVTSAREVKLEVLRGWLDGDGYVKHKHNARSGKSELRIQGTSVSRGLARDMTTLALSVGIKASMCRRKARKQSKQAYDVYLSNSVVADLLGLGDVVDKNHITLFGKDGARCEFGYCRKVCDISVEHVENLTVYDIEVEVDHSFLHEDVILHNCVGAGFANALRTLGYVEIANGDAEEWPLEEGWWPWTYGRGRVRAGLSGPGEGSFGSAQAEAAVQDGWFFRNELSGLPDFQKSENWLVLPKSVELEWSDGRAKSQHGPLGAKHPVKTAARIRTSEEAKAALTNGYPLTIASMFGTRGARATGTPAVQLAEWDDRWAHQMSCQGCWDHPTLGLIFYILNQWGSSAHPAPLNGEPPGGFWVRASTLDMMLKDEGFAFSGFEGYPARELSWYI